MMPYSYSAEAILSGVPTQPIETDRIPTHLPDPTKNESIPTKKK